MVCGLLLGCDMSFLFLSRLVRLEESEIEGRTRSSFKEKVDVVRNFIKCAISQLPKCFNFFQASITCLECGKRHRATSRWFTQFECTGGSGHLPGAYPAKVLVECIAWKLFLSLVMESASHAMVLVGAYAIPQGELFPITIE